MEKTNTHRIDERTKRIIIGVTSACVPEAKVYLFGSRARGTEHHGSDIDIALDAGVKLPRAVIGEIRDMLNASHIPQRIDVVDFHAVPPAMQTDIREQGILWKD